MTGYSSLFRGILFFKYHSLAISKNRPLTKALGICPVVAEDGKHLLKSVEIVEIEKQQNWDLNISPEILGKL